MAKRVVPLLLKDVVRDAAWACKWRARDHLVWRGNTISTPWRWKAWKEGPLIEDLSGSPRGMERRLALEHKWKEEARGAPPCGHRWWGALTGTSRRFTGRNLLCEVFVYKQGHKEKRILKLGILKSFSLQPLTPGFSFRNCCPAPPASNEDDVGY